VTGVQTCALPILLYGVIMAISYDRENTRVGCVGEM
jgi:hypothetical protein